MRRAGILAAMGLVGAVAACSNDSNPTSRADGGSSGGAATGGGGASSGGATSTGGASASGGAASGGTNATGGTASGSGGAATSGGASGSGGQGATEGGTGAPAIDAGSTGDGGLHIEHVFVIAMENHDQSQIIGDTADAPYINDTLLKQYASASNFNDVLALAIPSEPHYVLMEAGTNAFSDVTFGGDDNPSAANSTANTDHLVTQMENAAPPVTWMSYQEGLDATTGSCPINADGFFAPKHDPFVFFQDVAGSPPSATNAYCVSHHKAMTALADDVKNDTVASYDFLTPNLCNDMHGAAGCPNSNTIRSGDDWLSTNLPPLIDYVNGHEGVIFVVWDEGSATLKIPFLAIGPGVKKNYVGAISYTHRSLVKSVERIFGLPYLATVAADHDFADLFEDGRFP